MGIKLECKSWLNRNDLPLPPKGDKAKGAGHRGQLKTRGIFVLLRRV